jgi:hypothetical protein
VFDPDRVDATEPRSANDLPGAGLRLVSESVGVEHVFVNGVEIRDHDGPTPHRPGTLLRSGRHTRTVRTR